MKLINWLQDHVWMCTYVIMGLAVLTFLLNFIFKRIKNNNESLRELKKVILKAFRNKNSTINQSAGDMTITISQKDESGR